MERQDIRSCSKNKFTAQKCTVIVKKKNCAFFFSSHRVSHANNYVLLENSIGDLTLIHDSLSIVILLPFYNALSKAIYQYAEKQLKPRNCPKMTMRYKNKRLLNALRL